MAMKREVKGFYVWTAIISFLTIHIRHIQGLQTFQRFDKQPTYSEVNPGDDIKLDCKIFNKKGTCSWQKDNKPVGIYVRKYEWSGSQEAGDCSLWVRAATLEFDDGEWECQVTASEFSAQDALTSTPVRLVVRVAPQRPRIEHQSKQVLPGNNVTARSGEKTTVKCISRYGNPPAKIKWFLGETELVGNQSNSPEMDNPRTWVASSVLELHAEKIQHGKTLRCAAIHESYPTKAQSLDVRLDVTYPPEVRLIGTPTVDLEEARDNVAVRCVTDANPPATVIWTKSGRPEPLVNDETLSFNPITRANSGTYSCQASNNLGTSEPLTVNIDVKFGPSIKSVGPHKQMTASLFSEASFDCEAEASPTPSYQWLQNITGMEPPSVLVRSNDARLHIRNVSYVHQGEYICRVWNYIGGSERSVQSNPVILQVVGAPQVMRGSSGSEVIALRGSDAVLALVVCADPRPQSATWEWGSLRLQVGEGLGRYQAEQLQKESRDDCYEARLNIREVDPTDSRTYYLTVENERGADRHYLRLAVRGSYTHEPLALMTVVSLAAGCLTFFLVCILCGVYCARAEKCCFSRRSDFQPTDLESEKSDMSSMMGPRKPNVVGGPGVRLDGPPRPEALYRSGPHSITAPSPDAMKRELKKKKRRPRKGKSECGGAMEDVPTVSSHNHGPSGLPQRMAYYTKSFPSHSDYVPSPYFCPAQTPRGFSYDSARTMRASTYYQPNSIDKAEI